jgi:adducin
MRQMESRQRVSSILNSQAFREELDSIIADQLKHGPNPASTIALQQISELLFASGDKPKWSLSSKSTIGLSMVL